MSITAFIAGLCWLTAGLLELNTALSHAKQYGYRPWLYAAWFWLASAMAAFVVAFLTSAGGKT